MHPWRKSVGSAAAIGFGAYIALTSLVGILLGVQAGDGWLAILYGALGISMGLAGIASAFVDRPLRSALLGWFLVGIAARAVLVGDLFFLVLGVPVACVLLGTLVVELSSRASAANTLWGIAGSALSVIAFVLLVAAAPHLPVICPSLPEAGKSVLLISYPIDSVFPWDDGVEELYFERCAT
jgi:hypothetical protein